jgi:hypothetical protein
MKTTISPSESKPTLADTREAITALIRKLIDDIEEDFIVDHRREGRHATLMPVNVVPVSETGQSLATAFVAVVHDLSSRGISMLHTSEIEHTYLFLRFPDARVKTEGVVLEVLRRRKIGPLWEIAGKFVTEIPQTS